MQTLNQEQTKIVETTTLKNIDVIEHIQTLIETQNDIIETNMENLFITKEAKNVLTKLQRLYFILDDRIKAVETNNNKVWELFCSQEQ